MHDPDRPQGGIAHHLHGKDHGGRQVTRVPECGNGQRAQRPAAAVPALETLMSEVRVDA